MTALDDALRPYCVVSGRVGSTREPRRSTGIGCKAEWFAPPPLEPLEAILADDEIDYGPGNLEWVPDPPHHGYDALVTIAVMPLPPMPEMGNGDTEGWVRYIKAMERRGHARALLDGVCEGVWEQ